MITHITHTEFGKELAVLDSSTIVRAKEIDNLSYILWLELFLYIERRDIFANGYKLLHLDGTL